MKKRRLNDAILEEAARRVVEEDYQRQNEKALEFPHTFCKTGQGAAEEAVERTGIYVKVSHPVSPEEKEVAKDGMSVII